MVLLRVPSVPVLTVRFLPVSAAVGTGLLRPAIRPVPALRSLRATAAVRQVPPRRFRGRRLPAAATVRSIRAVRFLRLPLPFIARAVGPETVPVFHQKGRNFVFLPPKAQRRPRRKNTPNGCGGIRGRAEAYSAEAGAPNTCWLDTGSAVAEHAATPSPDPTVQRTAAAIRDARERGAEDVGRGHLIGPEGRPEKGATPSRNPGAPSNRNV